jgi:methanogenic corrinoid protein MtbC1
MYRRYTLDEVKRKIVDVLQNAGTGLSGVELADKTGINRMTITKYLDIMHTMGLIKKKKAGTVNIWFLETGVSGIEFPINYVQVQQKLIDFSLAGEEEQARRLLISVLNSNVDEVKVITDVILPAANTIGELYSRGRLGKTERIHLAVMMSELVDLVKFNSHPAEPKMNAHVLCLAGTDDKAHLAKSAAVVFRILGWDSRYIGSIEQDIDPFFDIDLQRYVNRVWGNKQGLLLVCVFSSEEGPLRFIASTLRVLKGRLRGEMRLVALAFEEEEGEGEEREKEVRPQASENADHVSKDIQEMVKWAERQYISIISSR